DPGTIAPARRRSSARLRTASTVVHPTFNRSYALGNVAKRVSWISSVLLSALIVASCSGGGGGGGGVGGWGGSAGGASELPWVCTLWTSISNDRMFCDCAYKYVPDFEAHTIVSHCDPTSFSVASVCCSY